MDEKDIELEKRLSRLEIVFENTQRAITNLAENTEKQFLNISEVMNSKISAFVDSDRQGHFELKNAIQRLSEDQKNAASIKWGPILTGLGLTFTFFGAIIFYIILKPVSNLHIMELETREMVYDHISDGHPATIIQKAEANEKRISTLGEYIDRRSEKLQENLRREMEMRDKLMLEGAKANIRTGHFDGKKE